ncbi:MAG: DUF5050 domain-containing protein, partial [Clostridia bacterium]
MKKIIIWIVAVVLVLSAGVFVWFKFWNKPVEAPKTQEKPPVADSKEPVDAAKVQAEIIELTEKQKKEPQNVDNALELAAAYAKLGKIDEARGAINNVAALVPGDTRLYIEMVNIYESKGRYLDALLFVDGINDANAKKITETKLRDQGFGGYAGFGNSAGNIANEGCVAADDKYVYYSESQDGGALYRADLDGKNKLKLSDGKTRYINVVGDTLYFSNIDDGYFIYTVKNDGTGRKKIVNKLAQKLTIFDDRLYFVDWSDSCKVHSVKLDGSDDKVFINVPVHELSLSGAWFMYTNSDDNESLYRIRVDGKANEKLGNENALFVNADREYAYYANWSDGGKL